MSEQQRGSFSNLDLGSLGLREAEHQITTPASPEGQPLLLDGVYESALLGRAGPWGSPGTSSSPEGLRSSQLHKPRNLFRLQSVVGPKPDTTAGEPERFPLSSGTTPRFYRSHKLCGSVGTLPYEALQSAT